MPIPLGIIAVAGAGAAGGAGAYELIQTQVLSNSTTSTITFSSIPSTYKHLQIRAVTKSTISNTNNRIHGRINGITTGVYTSHNLRGNGSTVTSNLTTTSATMMNDIGGFNAGTYFEGENEFAGLIMDILDYTDTNKNTTVRSMSGYRGSSLTPYVFFASGLYMQTTAVSSIELYLPSDNYVSGSRFSLYGIKG